MSKRIQSKPEQNKVADPVERSDRATLVHQVKALAIQKGRTHAQQRYLDRARSRFHYHTPKVRTSLLAGAQRVLTLLAANVGVATTDELERALADLGAYTLHGVRRDLSLIAVRWGDVWYTVDIEPAPEVLEPTGSRLVRAG